MNGFYRALFGPVREVVVLLSFFLAAQAAHAAPPAAPSTPDMTAGSDSGSSSTDNITNVTTPAFTGTGTEGDRVYLTVNNGTTTTTTTNYAIVAAGGTWSLELPTGLTDGGYTIAAKQSADGGATFGSVSGGLAITIDTTAPNAPMHPVWLMAASDTGASSTDGITSDTTPTMRVSLSGTNAVAGDSIQVLLGGAPLTHPIKEILTNTDITNNYRNLSVTAGDLGSDGSKTFTAQVTDVAGNVGLAGPSYTMTLDTRAPTGVANASNLNSPTHHRQ